MCGQVVISDSDTGGGLHPLLCEFLTSQNQLSTILTVLNTRHNFSLITQFNVVVYLPQQWSPPF